MRVALAQISSGRELAANHDVVAAQITAAADQGAELVIFPEATMRAFGNRLTEIAEPLDGPWFTGIGEVAERAGVTVILGGFTPGAKGDEVPGAPTVRNTLLVTGPTVRAHYDKIHLFDALGFTESATVTPGDQLCLVDLGGVRFGLTICYDIRFPQLYQELARRGAQAIVVIASWQGGPGKVNQWRTLAQARALDSTCWVLACGQAAPRQPSSAPNGVGHSMVVDPSGHPVASLGAEPGLLLWDLEVSDLERVRRELPVLANARELR